MVGNCPAYPTPCPTRMTLQPATPRAAVPAVAADPLCGSAQPSGTVRCTHPHPRPRRQLAPDSAQPAQSALSPNRRGSLASRRADSCNRGTRQQLGRGPWTCVARGMPSVLRSARLANASHVAGHERFEGGLPVAASSKPGGQLAAAPHIQAKQVAGQQAVAAARRAGTRAEQPVQRGAAAG